MMGSSCSGRNQENKKDPRLTSIENQFKSFEIHDRSRKIEDIYYFIRTAIYRGSNFIMTSKLRYICDFCAAQIDHYYHRTIFRSSDNDLLVLDIHKHGSSEHCALLYSEIFDKLLQISGDYVDYYNTKLQLITTLLE